MTIYTVLWLPVSIKNFLIVFKSSSCPNVVSFILYFSKKYLQIFAFKSLDQNNFAEAFQIEKLLYFRMWQSTD